MAFNRTRALTGIAVVLAIIVLGLPPGPPAQAQATFEVNEANDALSDGTCDLTCTLRDAIDEANATAVLDTIQFFIGGGSVDAVIPVNVALPPITQPVTINGLSQNDPASFCGDIDATVLTVVLEGTAGFDGLVVEDGGSGSTIRGLVINGFNGTETAGIRIRGDNTTVQCNFLGTDITGTTAAPNTYGLVIDGGANNIIGTVGQGNLFSGNTRYGVRITAATSTNNTLQGSIIGLNRDGTLALANGFGGVLVEGAPLNRILDNVISGNPDGLILNGSAANANTVQGNIIGLNPGGSAVIAGANYGIRIQDSPNNIIGGANPLQRNLVSGHAQVGIVLTGTNASGNQIVGNYVGTDSTGDIDLGNVVHGVWITGAVNNTVGGTSPEAGNVLSGNGQYGLLISDGASGNTATNNIVGLSAGFGAAIPNNVGIVVQDAANNFIGTPTNGNIVAGNSGSGITLVNAGTTGNRVQGNFVGRDNLGIPFGNGSYGIRVNGAFDNIVGGTGANEGNFVENSGNTGIFVGSTGTGNRIQGNQVLNSANLGIDLSNTGANDGVTANDVDDADAGSNGLLNFPVLSAARGTNNYTYISGTLDAPVGIATYRIEFYTNTACDASNHGEGEFFIGALDVTTDILGDATFSTSGLDDVFTGEFVTATTTGPANDTSEYSQCVQVTDAPEYAADVINNTTITLSTLIGSPSVATITVDNRDGRAQLALNTVTLTNAFDFTLLAPVVTPVTIDPGDPATNNTVLRVQCNADALGIFSTNITVQTNDPAQPTAGFTYTINCEVNAGVFPVYQSTPAPGQMIDLATTLNTPIDTTISVENTGTDVLNITSVTLTDTTNFSVTPTAFAIFSGSGTIVDVVVTCLADTLGSFSTTVTVNHNAAGTPATYTVNCSVTGTPNYVSNPINNTPINITTPQGTPLTTTVRVTNDGTATLNITNVAINNTVHFALDPATTAYTIAPTTGEAFIGVRCLATTTVGSPFSTTLTITHNATGLTATYPITCTVTPPAAPNYVSDPTNAATIDLTTTQGTPVNTTIRVTNDGTANLNITNVVLSNTTDFALVPATTAYTIAPTTGEALIGVQCLATTTTGSPFTTTLTVTHNATGSPTVYTINCTVNPPATPNYVSDPTNAAAIDLTTTQGTPVDATIRVTNDGTANLNITNVVLSNTTDFALVPATTTYTVAPTIGEALIGVRCLATTTTGSPFTTTLTVTHNAAGSPTAYTINCTVSAAAAPNYVSDPTNAAAINLTTTQGTPVDTTIRVTNDGTADLNITNVVLSNTTDFALVPATTAYTVAPTTGEALIGVRCLAAAAGSPTTTLTVTHNAAGSPTAYTINCTVSAAPTPNYVSDPTNAAAIDLTTTQGTPVTTTIRVTNDGTADLNITNVVLSNTTDFALVPATTAYTVAPTTGEALIGVQCLAAATGSQTTTLTVTHNAAGSPTAYTINCDVNVVGAPGYGSTPPAGATISRSTSAPNPVNGTLQVREIGTADLVISNVVLSNTTDFTLLSPANFTILEGGAAVDIVVQCNGTATPGAYTTTITVSHNAGADAVYTFNCTVTAPAYGSNPAPGAVIPLNTTFGTAVNTTIQVTEGGSEALTVSSIVLSDTTNFTLLAPAGGTFTITDGGAAVDVIIQCTAAAAGAFTTTVTINHNAAGSPATYTINCTVLAAGYASNPAPGGTINLATTEGTPVDAVITVTEVGDLDLDITNIVLSNPTNFSLAVPTSFTIVNDSGASEDIIVGCDNPTSGTPYTTTVTVTHNAPGSPAVYTINCTVNPLPTPNYVSNPAPGSTINLATTQGTPVATTVRVTNDGTANLNITNVVLSNTTAFALIPATTAYTVAPTTGEAPIGVRCLATTTTGSPFTTTLTVTHDAAGSPTVYTITCTVTPVPTGPGYGSTPLPGSTINVSVAIPGSVEASITVFETGSAALTVGPIALSGPAQFSLQTPASFTINDGGGSQLVVVRCTPTAVGTISTTVTVPTNDPARPIVTYRINCTATSAGSPVYTSAPAPGATITFPSALVGTTVLTTLAANNTGSATLTVSVPSGGMITGANVADFAVFQNGPPFSIAPAGQTRIITLRCIPLAVGTRTATLRFQTNDPARSLVTYSLVCTGVTVLPTPTPQIGVIPTEPPVVIGGTPIAAGPASLTGTVAAAVRGLAGRSGPYLGASLLRVVRPGVQYNILGRSTDEGGSYTWYLINVTGRDVWVSGRYFELTGTESLVPLVGNVFETLDDAPDTGLTVVTRSFVDLRRRPSPRSQILQPLSPNTRLALIGRTTQNRGNWWYHVRIDDIEGWIPAYAILEGGSIERVPVR